MSKPSNPKNLPLASAGKKSAANPQPPPQQQSPVRILNDGTITVGCHVKPGAKKSAILSLDTVVECSLAAPPRDGEANDELLALMSEHLECKKHQLSLVSGHKSRDKVVKVEGMEKDDIVVRLLKAVTEKNN